MFVIVTSYVFLSSSSALNNSEVSVGAELAKKSLEILGASGLAVFNCIDSSTSLSSGEPFFFLFLLPCLVGGVSEDPLCCWGALAAFFSSCFRFLFSLFRLRPSGVFMFSRYWRPSGPRRATAFVRDMSANGDSVTVEDRGDSKFDVEDFVVASLASQATFLALPIRVQGS